MADVACLDQGGDSVSHRTRRREAQRKVHSSIRNTENDVPTPSIAGQSLIRWIPFRWKSEMTKDPSMRSNLSLVLHYVRQDSPCHAWVICLAPFSFPCAAAPKAINCRMGGHGGLLDGNAEQWLLYRNS